MKGNETQKERFLVLDALRGIASILVVLYHYTTRYQELYCNSCKPFIEVKYGGYGVELFFILSGFVIFYSVEKKTSLVSFFYSRFFRLFPVYWSAMLVTSIFIASFGLIDRDVTLYQFFVNLTMFQEFFRVENIDGVYWTLAVELSFYFVIGLLLLLKLIPKIVTIINIWLIIYMLIKSIIYYSGHNPLPSYILILIDYSLLFCLGVIFNKLHSKKEYFYMSNIVFISLVYFFIATTSGGILSILIISIFYLFIVDKLNLLIVKPLLFLGAISYPLYLIHQNIGYIILNNMNEMNININIRILISLFFVVALAYLCHIMIEKPAMKLSLEIRKRLANKTRTLLNLK